MNVKRADLAARPALLFGFIGWHAETDAAVEGDGIDLDVETLTVGVLPGAADASPDRFAALSVADIIGNEARCFRGGWVIG